MNTILELTQKEYDRQKNTLNLIASENYPSPKTLELMGSLWSNKYGEGYPGKRYYAGNQFTDQLESFVQQKALQIFDKNNQYSVNVQVLSGSPANSMVFLSILNVGDKILSLNLANGGHLSHLHATSNWNKFFELVNYDVKLQNLVSSNQDSKENPELIYEIDEEDFIQKLKEFKPKLTILGGSSYPRIINFQKLTQIAHEHGSLVLADIAHINGLVATGNHPTPFADGDLGADFVSMTTHKTFRGPRSAMIFMKKEFEKEINKTIFPGTSGGPHFNKIAAIGQACLEILGEEKYPDEIDFKTYSQNTLKTNKALENSLSKNGLQIISPTQNHLCLVKLPENLDSLEIQNKLEEIGIICNRNVIPFDQKSAWRPSGLRLGTPALTSRGLNQQMATNLGQIISDLIFAKKSVENLKTQTQDLVNSLNWWY